MTTNERLPPETTDMPLTSSSSLRGISLGLHACGLGAAAAIVYATWALVIAPLQNQHAVMSARIAEESRVQARGSAIRTRHREVDRQLADFEATFARVISRIPETPRESEFLAQITHLARTCQLKIQRYHPREPVNEGTHTALEVQLEATADYAGICRFLDGLRTLARLCRVTRLRVHAVGPEGTDLPIEMTLRIYFAPLAKPAVPETPHV